MQGIVEASAATPKTSVMARVAPLSIVVILAALGTSLVNVILPEVAATFGLQATFGIAAIIGVVGVWIAFRGVRGQVHQRVSPAQNE